MSSGQESCREWGCSAAAHVRVRCRCTMVDVAAGVGGWYPRLTGSASEGLIGQLSREPLPSTAQCLACQVSGSRGHGGGAEEWSELAVGNTGSAPFALAARVPQSCQARQPTTTHHNPPHRGPPLSRAKFCCVAVAFHHSPSRTLLHITANHCGKSAKRHANLRPSRARCTSAYPFSRRPG